MTDSKTQARIEARADVIVAAAPPFTEEQRAAIVRILGPIAREMAAERLAAEEAARKPRRRRGGTS
ncbi:hypothetical protein [Cellulosimicrobium sp. SL-1]|uniref:hypothetical protein n=1 Tax=Cellulosimicrobium sp. SL-1 TaxID=2699423 RepID=UPI0013D78200|nr:hypothetical protein [Cellulosimicrobium sp. SL-1]